MNPSEFPSVMVATAQIRSLSDLLRSITSALSHCPNVALARIWLIAPGDVCRTCLSRPRCPDQARCLHLVASAGNLRDGSGDASRIDGTSRRFPLGVPKMGSVATTGTPLRMTGLRGDEAWLSNPAWIAREGVRTIAAQPLAFRGDVLGVLGVFDRGDLDDAAFEWLRVFADHAAVSIANVRAFEEIERLRAQLEEENLYLREEVSAALGMREFVGSSPALQKVLRQIELVAPTDASVLITGESGTGKELVARAIHERSSRKSRALIKVNCGAIPEGLFESEFFGHVRGSFTGAVADRPGRFELADRGTLFLDEVGELTLPMQAKLLRALQEGEIERVGESRPRKVNVRVIAATNRHLAREGEAGRFRQDLFYRLSVFPVDVPPLRERREDVPNLVRHFVAESARRLNTALPKLTTATMARLVDYSWPGNVRELQNVIERAVILAAGGALRVSLGEARGTAPEASRQEAAPAGPMLTRADLRRAEREAIESALGRSGGRVYGPSGAAALLGMKPTTLASRIKVLRIDPRQARPTR